MTQSKFRQHFKMLKRMQMMNDRHSAAELTVQALTAYIVNQSELHELAHQLL